MIRWTLLLVLTLTAGALGAPKPPHIVLYLADDHGVDFVGCYGNTAIRTPNIDALAATGTRFTRAFAASPTCSPSRANIYTGLHAARTGVMGNHTNTRPGLKSLPTYLKPLGYRVVIASKADVRPKEVYDFEYLPATLPKNPAINRRYRNEGLDTKEIDRFLAEHAVQHPDQPLCLVLGDNGPHVVWEPNHTYDPAALPVPPIMVDTPKTRAALANYYQDITTVDGRVGDVLASLKKYGMEKNTLFIYTADQGPEWPHAKWTVYDAGLREPFIVRYPEGWSTRKPGGVCDAIVSFVDITPTFIDVAGGTPPDGLDGRSFKDVLLGKSETFRGDIYASHTGDKEMNVFPQRGVRDARYKYVLNLMPQNKWTTHFTKVEGIPNSHAEVYNTWLEKAKTDAAAAKLVETIERHTTEELYDTEHDYWELHNLAAEPAHADRLAAMRGKVIAWMTQQQDPELQTAVKLTSSR